MTAREYIESPRVRARNRRRNLMRAIYAAMLVLSILIMTISAMEDNVVAFILNAFLFAYWTYMLITEK